MLYGTYSMETDVKLTKLAKCARYGAKVVGNVSCAMQDIFYDPQTSGGLLMAIPADEADTCLTELQAAIPLAQKIGYVTEKLNASIYLE